MWWSSDVRRHKQNQLRSTANRVNNLASSLGVRNTGSFFNRPTNRQENAVFSAFQVNTSTTSSSAAPASSSSAARDNEQKSSSTTFASSRLFASTTSSTSSFSNTSSTGRVIISNPNLVNPNVNPNLAKPINPNTAVAPNHGAVSTSSAGNPNHPNGVVDLTSPPSFKNTFISTAAPTISNIPAAAVRENVGNF